MTTVNSISGGKTSAYIAANYPADYNIFSLVRTNDKSCQFPDAKIRQMVSDKIGQEFVGTLEQDEIIYTMLDLEQFIGQPITWITGKTFDELVYMKSGKINMPGHRQRSCTYELKVVPIANWWYKNIGNPIIMNIGFRANEMSRAKKMIEKYRDDGLQWEKFIIGKHKNGNNKWKELGWRELGFPLINDAIYKDDIEEFWVNKPVRFAHLNNCVGCFNRSPILLKHMSNQHPNKFDWFLKVENASLKYKNNTWKKGVTYEKIKAHKTQFTLFDDDFNDCDSGYCGL
jgi:hypothetical protein